MQDEYKLAYLKMFPDTKNEEYDAIWAKADADGDGNLTVEELAKYYGFSWDSEMTTEMTDEQILEALQMQAALADLSVKKEEEKPKEEKPKEPKKDSTIKNVNTDGKKASATHHSIHIIHVPFCLCCLAVATYSRPAR